MYRWKIGCLVIFCHWEESKNTTHAPGSDFDPWWRSQFRPWLWAWWWKSTAGKKERVDFSSFEANMSGWTWRIEKAKSRESHLLRADAAKMSDLLGVLRAVGLSLLLTGSLLELQTAKVHHSRHQRVHLQFQKRKNWWRKTMTSVRNAKKDFHHIFHRNGVGMDMTRSKMCGNLPVLFSSCENHENAESVILWKKNKQKNFISTKQGNKMFEITVDCGACWWKGHYAYAKVVNVELQTSTRSAYMIMFENGPRADFSPFFEHDGFGGEDSCDS